MSGLGRIAHAAIRWLIATALFLMMVVTFFDVIGRYLVNRPLPGAAEIVQYLMVTFIFVALPVVSLRNEHISISLVESLLGRTGRKVQGALVSAASAVVMGGIAWRLWLHGGMLAANRDVIGYLSLPVAPAAFLASVFAGITAAVLIVMAVSAFIDKLSRGQGNDARDEHARR